MSLEPSAKRRSLEIGKYKSQPFLLAKFMEDEKMYKARNKIN
jgi:hypothetical protein